MVGFAMALGGAMKGYGNATLDKMKADALAKREEALAQANFERQRILAGEARQFQTQQDESQRAFTREENEKGRAADQAYRDRSLGLEEQRVRLAQEQSGDVVQTEDGPAVRRGTTVEPITDKDGNRVRLQTTGKEKPADIATAEWLITNGVAKDPTEAFQLIKQGVKADATPAEVEKMVEAATKAEIDAGAVGADEIDAAREKNRARIEKVLGISKPDDGIKRTGGSSGTKENPAEVNNRSDWEKLPSGTFFTGPDGVLRTKP